MSTWPVIAPAAAGSMLLVVAVWARLPVLIAWGLAGLGGSFAVGLVSGRVAGLGPATPLVAAALLAVGEAAFYGAERASGTEYGARQALRLTLAAFAGLAVSASVLLAATIAAPRSLVLTVGGTLAAVIAIALPSAWFRRFWRRV
jgi:hypothetical protein